MVGDAYVCEIDGQTYYTELKQDDMSLAGMIEFRGRIIHKSNLAKALSTEKDYEESKTDEIIELAKTK